MKKATCLPESLACGEQAILRSFFPRQVKRVRCESSGAMVPKDKAIKRFVVRNMVDASALRDLQEASVIDGEPPFFCALPCLRPVRRCPRLFRSSTGFS